MKQTVSFTSGNANISGHLYLPKNKEEKFPCIVLCHGFCGVKELLLPTFAQYFSDNGFAALTFDYRGFGESGGEPGRLVPNLQIEDIQEAINYVCSLPQIDSSKIALWGTSFGGANAIVAATQTDKVRCLAVQLTFANGERVITGNLNDEQKEKFLATLEKIKTKKATTGKEMMVPIAKVLTDKQSKDFYNQYANDFPALKEKIPFLTIAETINHKPETVCDKLTVPFHITGAGKDSVNPPEETKILFDKVKSEKQLLMLDDATHYEVYEGNLFKQVAKAQKEWFKKHL